MTETNMSWADRFTRLAEIGDQRDALYTEQQALGQALEARLAIYEQMIEQHGLSIEVPCGFRPNAHGFGDDIFWRFAYLCGDMIVFTHKCNLDHGERYSYGDEELVVPRMALTHPEEWLILAALTKGREKA